VQVRLKLGAVAETDQFERAGVHRLDIGEPLSWVLGAPDFDEPAARTLANGVDPAMSRAAGAADRIKPHHLAVHFVDEQREPFARVQTSSNLVSRRTTARALPFSGSVELISGRSNT
jgi:hypothetical protein